MNSLQEAIAEAFENHTRWMGGAVVVDHGVHGYEALAGMTVTDISYSGSKKVVHSLRQEISDREYGKFIAYQEKMGRTVPTRLSDIDPDDYAKYATGI